MNPDAGFDKVTLLRGAVPASKGSGVSFEDANRPGKILPETMGSERLMLIAGPCAVESREMLVPLANELRDAGADWLRGGAFKPRTRPSDFQGLGTEGVRLLAEAKQASGLPVVTEVVDTASFVAVRPVADMVQVGARNMQNFELLKEIGRDSIPVLLKRGFSADLDEWLAAVDYLQDGGNSNVVLCERGIRTFSRHSRFTLDLSVLPALRRRTGLPVLVDPSHATGDARAVPSMARAAVAAGADGVMVEVHPDPPRAICDGSQALTPSQFAALAAHLRELHAVTAGRAEPVP